MSARKTKKARSWRRGAPRLKELLEEIREEVAFDSFDLTRDAQEAIAARVDELERFIDGKYRKGTESR